MLAYSMQDLILEPFAGLVFGMSPGESTSLSGTQHSGVLLGMIIAGVGGSAFAGRLPVDLRVWIVAGCAGSGCALAGLAIAALAGPGWPLAANVFVLGLCNGVFAVSAIGAMMGLAGAGENTREGVRMGVWGAAQAVANVLRRVPDLPWWRVVPTSGRLYRTHAPTQQPLLEAEGVAVVAAPFDVAALDPPGAALDRVEAALGPLTTLVNNAGVLRDKSFAKMDLDDFRFVVDVHLMGAVNCTKAVWEIMRLQNYGRIVMTTSSSGLYGNFGQSNYGAAKMALVGLMQTLSIEGQKNDIRVNCLAPTAHTRMTEDLGAALPLDQLGPELVSPGLVHLVSEDAPTRCILAAGAGGFERAYVTLTQGIRATGADAREQIAARFDDISDRSDEIVPDMGAAQGMIELGKLQNAMKG